MIGAQDLHEHDLSRIHKIRNEIRFFERSEVREIRRGDLKEEVITYERPVLRSYRPGEIVPFAGNRGYTW